MINNFIYSPLSRKCFILRFLAYKNKLSIMNINFGNQIKDDNVEENIQDVEMKNILLDFESLEDIRIKNEPMESTENGISSGCSSKQIWAEEILDEPLENVLDVAIKDVPLNSEIYQDVKIKNEPSGSTKDDIFSVCSSELVWAEEGIQEQNYLTIDVKSELDIKDEPLNLEREDSTNDLPLGQISGFDETQTLIIDVGCGEKPKRSTRSKSQISRSHNQMPDKNDLKKLFCLLCNLSFKKKNELKSHLRSHNERMFKCNHCSYESECKNLLKLHLLKHSNTKLFKCSDCSHECNRKSSLQKHMLTHTNFKLFKCSDCSYECNQKSNLKTHMLTHSKIKLFKCSDCNYECSLKGNLKLHMLTHANFKLLKCSVCSYECNRKDTLKRHMLTHGNLKLFKCSECEYESNQNGNLKLHKLTHSKFKLFKCSDCSYESYRKDGLKKHMLTHADFKLFKCSQCNYECNKKASLRKHMIKKTFKLMAGKSVGYIIKDNLIESFYKESCYGKKRVIRK